MGMNKDNAVDFAYKRTKISIGVKAVFTALEHKGTKAQVVSVIAAGKYFFFTQTVSFAQLITFSYSAVKTVVFTYITYFNKASDVKCVSVNFFSESHCFFTKHRCCFFIITADKLSVFLKGKAMLFNKL